jgi:hypothetical protein
MNRALQKCANSGPIGGQHGVTRLQGRRRVQDFETETQELAACSVHTGRSAVVLRWLIDRVLPDRDAWLLVSQRSSTVTRFASKRKEIRFVSLLETSMGRVSPKAVERGKTAQRSDIFLNNPEKRCERDAHQLRGSAQKKIIEGGGTIP